VIVLGDYNETTNTDEGHQVLAPLLGAPDRYRFRDDAAVAAGEHSFVPSGKVIDHMLTTAGFDAAMAGASAIIPHLDVQYPRYESMVSDHLPVVLSIPMP
jgi:endonuclease/exonuclease/phosphatase family metal-dependent hydrolase